MEKYKLLDEVKKAHLIKSDGTTPYLVILKCKRCGLKKEPAALFYRKVQLEKGTLKCRQCGNAAFVRTDRTEPQGKLFQKAIANKTPGVNKKLEEIKEAITGTMADVFKIRQERFMKTVDGEADEQ